MGIREIFVGGLMLGAEMMGSESMLGWDDVLNGGLGLDVVG